MDPYEYKGADPAAYVPLPWDPVGRSMVDPAADVVIGAALQVVAEDPTASATRWTSTRC